jgi:L,D-transpeptidase ErfK/SrfK
MTLAPRDLRAVVALVLVWQLAGCVAPPKPPKPPSKAAKVETGLAYVRTPDVPAGGVPAVKVATFTTRVPTAGEKPEIAGKLQLHRVKQGEDLLTISRDMGIGFRALRDANPFIDEWEPEEGTELLVPTRWILPRAELRGLVINVAELRAFMFPVDASPGEEVPVLTWPIGAGDIEWPTPLERFTVVGKDTNPTWVVPASIYRTMENPVYVVPPGPDNPLGKHRIKLSIESYLLHGTNDPWSVGRLTTHGCVRFYPEDVEQLYGLVYPGYPGQFIYQPVKVTEVDGRVYLEVHRDIYLRVDDLEAHARAEIARAGLTSRVDPAAVSAAVEAQNGMPLDVTLAPTRTAVSE